MSVDLRILPDPETLSRAAATAIVAHVRLTIEKQDRFSLAVAGGNTPRALYSILAAEFGGSIPWERVHVFWTDERYVPHDNPLSNYRLVCETLLDRVRIPWENVHPMPTGFPQPDDAASAYETVLRAYFPPPWPRFDLVLLGMGTDGHTASLFPGSPALEERLRWVTVVTAPAEPPRRLTLTMPAILQSASLHFLIAGQEKAAALRDSVAGGTDRIQPPAAAVLHSAEGTVVCWVDDAAASLLSPARS